MKKSTYIRAIKTLPDYFIDDATQFAIADERCMVVSNPKFAPMWYDSGSKKVKWRALNSVDSPFYINENRDLILKSSSEEELT